MTQEDKVLLLKDLCARLPYGIIVNHKGLTRPLFSVSPTQCYQITLDNAIDGEHNGLELVSLDIDEVELKPYLRPMSSITEEEKKDFPFPYYFEWIDSNFSLLCSNDEVCASIGFDEMYEIMDWLNFHHFDYRGLIPKGLALVAPERMYNIK